MKVISLLHYRSPECTEAAARALYQQIMAQPDTDSWRLIVFEAQDSVSESLPIDALPPVSHIALTNEGFTRNWNNAFEIVKKKIAEWEFFGFFNNDILPAQDFIAHLLQPFYDDESVGILTPTFNSPHRFIYTETGEVFEAPYIEFTAPVIRRKAFAQTGPLDNRFRLGWGVDVEYCYRLRHAGFKCVVNGMSRFKHLEHKSIAEFKTYAKEAHGEMTRGLMAAMGADWRRKILDGWDKERFSLPI